MTEPQNDGNATVHSVHSSDLFILDDNRNPVHCPDIYEWGAWVESESNRRVSLTRIGSITVRTMFFGVRIPAPPESGIDYVFFETSVSSGFYASALIRTQTYNGAMHAHGLACGRVLRFRFIPPAIQDWLRLIHDATTYFRFRLACAVRAIFP